jgi:hypothetical protein
MLLCSSYSGYSALWVVTLVVIAYFWNVPIVVKVILSLMLIIGTPTLSDLFQSYSDYVEWHRKYVGRANLPVSKLEYVVTMSPRRTISLDASGGSVVLNLIHSAMLH